VDAEGVPNLIFLASFRYLLKQVQIWTEKIKLLSKVAETLATGVITDSSRRLRFGQTLPFPVR